MGKNRDRTGVAFGFGLLLGGVAGFFLASDKGRELTGKASKELMRVSGEMEEKARGELVHLSAKMDELLENSKSMAENLEQSVKQGTQKTHEKVDEVVEKSVDSFKKGIDKARGNLESNKT